MPHQQRCELTVGALAVAGALLAKPGTAGQVRQVGGWKADGDDPCNPLSLSDLSGCCPVGWRFDQAGCSGCSEAGERDQSVGVAPARLRQDRGGVRRHWPLVWLTWVMLDVKNMQSGFTFPTEGVPTVQGVFLRARLGAPPAL